MSRQADVDQHPIESNSSASTFCDLVQETIAQLNGGNVQTAADVEGTKEMLQMTGWCRENDLRRVEEGETQELNGGRGGAHGFTWRYSLHVKPEPSKGRRICICAHCCCYFSEDAAKDKLTITKQTCVSCFLLSLEEPTVMNITCVYLELLDSTNLFFDAKNMKRFVINAHFAQQRN